MESDREKGSQVRPQKLRRRRKGEIHIHVQIAHWIYETDRPNMDSKGPCCTALVVRMTGVYDGLEWPFQHLFYVPRSGERYLLTGEDCRVQ